MYSVSCCVAVLEAHCFLLGLFNFNKGKIIYLLYKGFILSFIEKLDVQSFQSEESVPSPRNGVDSRGISD